MVLGSKTGGSEACAFILESDLIVRFLSIVVSCADVAGRHCVFEDCGVIVVMIGMPLSVVFCEQSRAFTKIL